MHFSGKHLIAAAVLCAASTVRAEPGAAEPVARSPEGAERVAIGAYIRAHLQPLEECYDQRLTTQSTLRGRLVIRFDIESQGRATNASADGMSDRKLIDCVVAQILTWQFEKPPPGTRLRVAYPLLFQPS